MVVVVVVCWDTVVVSSMQQGMMGDTTSRTWMGLSLDARMGSVGVVVVGGDGGGCGRWSSFGKRCWIAGK